MNEITLASGQTAHYEYDPSDDTLLVRLREAELEGSGTAVPGAAQVRAYREEATGALLGLRVRSVQQLLLERLVADLVRLADVGVAPAEAEQATIAPDEPLEEDGSAKGGRKRRGRRRKKRSPEEAVAEEPAAEADRADRGPQLTTPTEPEPPAAPARGAAPPGTPVGFAPLRLDPRLGGAIADLGFPEPTEIQRRAIPPALTGRDVMGLAQTGTGKTLAFLLPGIARLLAEPSSRHATGLLVITPTRELAIQVGEQAAALTRYADLTSVVVYGGAPLGTQARALKAGADIVIATPGRLLDHVGRRNLRLDAVRVLVLDEADRMLDMGFMPDIRRIVDMVPEERQTLMFGATLPPDIESLSHRFQKEPELVEIARQLPPATLDQALYPVGKHLKTALLVHLLRSDPDLSKVLVFTETKVETDVVARRLTEAGVSASAMHGDRPQKDRERALEDLRSGRIQALVATNVAARGLDIEHVSHVVNHDMPQSVDDYIHRVGRTARAEAVGEAFTLVAPEEETELRAIERAVGQRLPRVTVPDFDYSARSEEKLEVPLAERIAAIRARKAEERARATINAERRAAGLPVPRRSRRSRRLRRPA